MNSNSHFAWQYMWHNFKAQWCGQMPCTGSMKCSKCHGVLVFMNSHGAGGFFLLHLFFSLVMYNLLSHLSVVLSVPVFGSVNIWSSHIQAVSVYIAMVAAQLWSCSYWQNCACNSYLNCFILIYGNKFCGIQSYCLTALPQFMERNLVECCLILKDRIPVLKKCEKVLLLKNNFSLIFLSTHGSWNGSLYHILCIRWLYIWYHTKWSVMYAIWIRHLEYLFNKGRNNRYQFIFRKPKGQGDDPLYVLLFPVLNRPPNSFQDCSTVLHIGII